VPNLKLAGESTTLIDVLLGIIQCLQESVVFSCRLQVPHKSLLIIETVC